MNKYVVVYRSKYGATKKYALMLKEELSCEIYDAADYKKIPFERYSYVIFAGAVYAGGMAGLDILRKVYKNIWQFFYARGAWNEGRMTFKDRILCGILQKVIARQEAASLEPWMEELLRSKGRICDWTDKKNLLPLLEYIK